MTRLFSILLAFGLVLILSTTVLNLGYAGPAISIGYGAGYGVQMSGLQRVDAGTITAGPIITYAPRWKGHSFLLDVGQSTEGGNPSTFGLAYVLLGGVDDSHLYVGGKLESRWLDTGTDLLGGPQVGLLIPINKGSTIYYRVGGALKFNQVARGELEITNGVQIELP